jgi:hypothetical protein
MPRQGRVFSELATLFNVINVMRASIRRTRTDSRASFNQFMPRVIRPLCQRSYTVLRHIALGRLFKPDARKADYPEKTWSEFVAKSKARPLRSGRGKEHSDAAAAAFDDRRHESQLVGGRELRQARKPSTPSRQLMGPDAIVGLEFNETPYRLVGGEEALRCRLGRPIDSDVPFEKAA